MVIIKTCMLTYGLTIDRRPVQSERMYEYSRICERSVHCDETMSRIGKSRDVVCCLFYVAYTTLTESLSKG